jgi:hypothetical protein
MCAALKGVSRVKEQLTTPYNPRANGQVERFNKIIAARLAKFTGEKQDSWDKYMATVCMSYNMTKHSSTGETPYYLMFGQEPRTGLDELLDLGTQVKYSIKNWREEQIPTMMQRMKYAQEKRRERQKENMNRKNKDKVNVVYYMNEKVWVRDEPITNKDKGEHKKLKSPWTGPYIICGADPVKYGNTYQVKEVRDGVEYKRVANISNLKPFYERPDWMKSEEEKATSVSKEKTEEESESEKDEDRSLNYAPPVIVQTNKEQNSTEVLKEKGNSEEKKGKGSENTQVGRRSSRIKEAQSIWVPEKGEGVDVRFQNRNGKSMWSCGTVTRVDKYVPQKVFIEFLDSKYYSDEFKNDDDYDLRDKSLEIRKCVESENHTRSAEQSVSKIDDLTKEEKDLNSKKRKNMRARINKKNKKKCVSRVAIGEGLDTGLVKEKAEGSTGSNDAMTEMEVRNRTPLQTAEATHGAIGTVSLMVNNRQIRVDGNVDFVLKFLGGLKSG